MKVLVTGGSGLVGSAIERYVKNNPSNRTFYFVNRKAADLTKESEVDKLFYEYQPDYVIHTAAKVGGIGGNMVGHAEYFYQNALINAHVIHHAWKNRVKKLLAFSSVCVFPDDVVILKEEVMHNGPPFAGNFAYAHAKRMVDVQIRAYKSQFNIDNYCSIIPGNIYGTHDFYNLQHGHVIPSLIHKIWKAKEEQTELKIWGDGKSLREFIFADDLARILVDLIEFESIPERLLISGFEQYAISEIVNQLVEIADFKGAVVYEPNKPNGQRNRQSDLTQFKSLFLDFKPTPLYDGLRQSYEWFASNYPNVRI